MVDTDHLTSQPFWPFVARELAKAAPETSDPPAHKSWLRVFYDTVMGQIERCATSNR